MPAAHGRVPDAGKIAVLRANAIGDFLFTLPALEALRAAYPGAEIVLLGQKWHAAFLNGRPLPIDRAVAVPPSQGVNDSAPGAPPEELDRFFREMTAERFDLAIQMHGGGRHSNPFVLRLGARLTAGSRTPDAPALDRWVPYVYFQPEVIRYLEVVGLVGARPVTLEPRLTVTPRDLADARPLLAEVGRPFVVLHPGSGDPRRRWPPEKFAAVGDALAAAGYRVLVNGARDEWPLVEAVLRALRAEAHHCCNRLSLEGLTGVLSRCRLMVSNDSGPLHLANAVGAASVGIYWFGNLATAGTLTRARHRPVPAWRLHCPVCGQECVHAPCRHSASFVADVAVEEVLAAAFAVLEATGPDGKEKEPTGGCRAG
jgi:ADP-heptose:LPS heptosyltransferase